MTREKGISTPEQVRTAMSEWLAQHTSHVDVDAAKNRNLKKGN